tara:strand:+ start:1125 stop:1313 length:189 start_codon:yes stop_codon:yes gene_type:complete
MKFHEQTILDESDKGVQALDKNEPILDLQSNLRKLNLLYENGTITKEEYLQKRERLVRESSL